MTKSSPVRHPFVTRAYVVVLGFVDRFSALDLVSLSSAKHALAINSNQAMMQVLDRDSDEIFVDYSLNCFFFVAAILIVVKAVWQTSTLTA